MDVCVDKRLVPFGLARLLHCFCPSLALVAACVSRSQQVFRGILFIVMRKPPCEGVLGVPAVREEVDFDIGAPGTPVGPQGDVHSLEHVDNQLMANFVVPQFHLVDDKQAKEVLLVPGSQQKTES